jgi:hypothetical protein
MLDILNYLPAKRKSTSSGWVSFNAPCCVHQGENQDKRQRGGLKPSGDGSWSYHCFNCGYTCSFVLGRNLSFKARKFLQWLNVPAEEIERINLESLKHKSIAGLLTERQLVSNELQGIKFDPRELPPKAELITAEHPTHVSYLRERQAPADYPFMTVIENDKVHWTRPQIIIPFTYNNEIVGYSCRMLDNRTPKYINDIQHGYVFGTDLQNDAWQYAIVVEGVFDALAINGLAVLHADVNDAQVRLIRSLNREIIVVPDQDEAGMKLVDRAVELGWAVSIPEWPKGCKDVNDAVIQLGRVGTLLTILEHKETSRIKIEMKRKNLVKRLRD